MRSKIYILLIVAVVGLIILTILYFVSGIFTSKETLPPPTSEKESIKTTSENKLVEGFPDIPIPSQATITNSYKKEESGLVGYEATLATTLSGYDVISWYKTGLLKLGWTIYDESIDKDSGELYLRAEKGNLKVNIFEDSDEENTLITIEVPYH